MKNLVKGILIAVGVMTVMGFVLSACAIGTGMAIIDKAVEDVTDVSDYTNTDINIDTSNMTISQQNAYESAKINLSIFSSSKKAIEDQLEFEGYEKADIKFVMNKLDVDWDKVAVDAAKSYIDSGSFSYDRLISQLSSEYDGFSKEQAEHAVNAISGEVDWEAECIEAAEDYMEYGNFSKVGLKAQLEFDKFEEKHIEAALIAVGY